MADRIGCRKVFFISSGCIAASGLGYGLAFDYYSFVCFRICAAIGTSGLIISSYVLSVEVVGISARSFAGMVGSAIFGSAYPILAVLAYFVRGWRVLALLITGAGVGMFALFR